jgi:uncharacterized membrane protein
VVRFHLGPFFCGGRSSIGRAPALHAGGQRFDSARLHYKNLMNPILKIIIFSLLPISELRGSIPIGLSSGLPLSLVFPIAVLSNILVFPIFYLFLTFVHKLLMKVKLYRKTFDYFLERTRRRVGPKVEKYGYLGLTLFVAIPLPVTGAYTGTLGAWFFKMRKRKSFFAVLLGVIIAGLIVSTVSVFGIHIFDIFIKKNL